MTDELDDVIAGLYTQGEQGAADAPPESPPPTVAAESEQASDAPAEPDVPVADEPLEDAAALKARLADIEAELQAKRDADEQARVAHEQRVAYEEQLRAWKAQQALEQEAQQLSQEFGNVDPEWGQRFQNFWQQTAQQRYQATQAAQASTHGLATLVKVLENRLTPEQFAEIATEAEELVSFNEQVVDQEIARRRTTSEQMRQRELEKDREIAELRLRIDAISRNPLADAVDAGSSGGPGTADWQNATTFDEFFDGMISANTAYG